MTATPATMTPGSTMTDQTRTEVVLAAVRRLLGAVADSAAVPTQEELGHAVGRAPDQLRRDFQTVIGMTPKALVDAARADRVRDALRTSPSVGEAVHDAGLTSTSRLYRLTAPTLGMDPAAYAGGADGEILVWTAFDTSLGRVLVAATDRGLASVLFEDEGDDPDAALGTELARRFPAATLIRDDVWLVGWRAVLAAHLDRPTGSVDLPLDLHGTAFQLRVWQALTKIEPGTTVTYKELAAAVGSPNGHRAVAGACAANNVAVAVPCHRVVRSDGSLAGYRWGTTRKAALIALETVM